MLIASCPPTPSSDPSGRRLVARKLAHLKKKLDSAATAIGAESVDVCLLQQYEVNLADYKRELGDSHNQILALDLDDKDELSVGHASREDAIFQLSIKIRKQLPPEQVFYLPMHTVRKDSSTTTKVRIVFDASAKSSTGMSLNDKLHTVHPPLINILLQFRFHRIALTTDVSKMYRAVRLVDSDKDLHRFVWRKEPSEPSVDYEYTRTLGIEWNSVMDHFRLTITEVPSIENLTK